MKIKEGKEEIKKRHESWDGSEIPKFHFGSHHSSAGKIAGWNCFMYGLQLSFGVQEFHGDCTPRCQAVIKMPGGVAECCFD